MRTLSSRLFALLVLVAAAMAAAAQSEITAVTTTKGNGCIAVNVKGENLPKPFQTSAYGGKVQIFSFADTTLSGRNRSISVNSLGVQTVQVVQFTRKPLVARVTIRVQPGKQAIAERAANGWCITIGSKPAAAKPTKSAPELEMEAAIKTLSKGITQGLGPANTHDVAIKNAVKTVTQATYIGAASPSLTMETTVTSSTVRPKTKKVNFPETVLPLEKPISTVQRSTASSINLNFVGADIVFIMKALAEQTGANIVTSPEVRGVLSVSLKNVTVEQALDLTTKLAGYRYAKIGNTFVVGTEAFLMRMLLNEQGANMPKSVMKVVPLASRKAGEIKRTILSALSLDRVNESLKILHPMADFGMAQSIMPATGADKTGGGQTGETGQNGGGQAAAPDGNKAGGESAGIEGDADYLILIGEKGRVEQANLLITQLDNALADMAGIRRNGSDDLRTMTLPYRVKGGRAEDLAKAIQAFAGSVSVVATPNGSRAGQTIVLQGRSAEVMRLVEVLEQIDSVQAGDNVYEVYDVRHSDPRALKDQLETMFPALTVAIGPDGVGSVSYSKPKAAGAGEGVATAGSGVTTGAAAGGAPQQGGTESQTGLNISGAPIFKDREPMAKPMKLILGGSRREVAEAMQFLARVDKPAPQVAIEARVVDLSKEDALRLGFDWNLFTGGAVKLIRFNNSQSDPSNTVSGHISGRNWGGDITANLDKMITKSNLISRPNVTAMDGREAVVFIGDIVRYIKSLQATQNGITVEVGEEEVGVKLNVLVRIGADNSLTLDVQPTVSFIKSFLNVPGGGQIPTTSVRTARTVLRLQNGETIAIGGLISASDRKEVSGVPILMDIPIIGQLFRSTTNTKTKSEIVIFLTARVVEEPNTSTPTTPPPAEKTKG